jgi:hypothetical protein
MKSKIKLGKTGVEVIKEWVIKTFLKQQPKGVLTTLPKKDFVDLNTAITAERLMRNGVDPNAIKNVDQVENIINQLNKPRAVAADSPEGKGITEALFGKKGEVFNIQGEKLDPSKPIVGGSQSGKKINREFFERNAEAKELQKRIDSGVASTVERILAMKPIDAMKEANLVIGRKGQYKNLSQEDAKKILQDTEDHIFERNVDIDPEDMFADGGRIGFFKGAVAGGGNISPGTDTKGNVRDDNPFTGGGKDEPPSPPTKDTKQKTPVVVNPIKNLQTHFANNQKLKDAVALGLITNDEYNVLGGYDAKQTLGMGPIDTGLSSLAYNVVQSFKGDQPFSDILGDVSRNVQGASSISPELQSKYENIMQMADGGRIGLKKGMDRRTFMKIMGGLTTLPVLGKFFKGAEVAAPVVEKAAEVASGAPPYFFNLVNRIRALGKQFPGPKERTETYKYKDYEMQIDNDTGQIEISKQKLGYDDRIGEGVVSEEYMSLKPGRADETTGGKKVVDEYEENTGYTDKDGKLKDVEPGVSKETVMDGSISKEELEQEIVEQLSKEAPSIKKASGGIARMLGE